VRNLFGKVVGLFFTTAAKQGYTALIDQAVVSGTNFLTGVLVARLCSKEEYGFYVLAFSLVFFADGIRNSLVGSPMVVFFARKSPEEQPSYIGAATVIHLIFLVLSGTVVAAVGGAVRLAGDSQLAVTLLVSIITVLGYSSREHIRRVFYAKLSVGRALSMNCVYSVLQLGALAVFWYVGELSAVGALLIVGFTQAASSVLGIVLLSRGNSFRKMHLREVLSSHLRLGGWLVAVSLLYTLAEGYPWFLKLFQGNEPVAVFGACRLVPNIINPVMTGFGMFADSWTSHSFSREGKKGLKRVVIEVQIILGLIAILFAAGVSIFAREILEIMFAGKYSGYGLIVAILSIPVVLRAVISPMVAGLTVLGRTSKIFVATLMSSIATFTVGIILVWKAGILGAALGVVVTGVISGCFILYFYKASMREVDGDVKTA